MYSKIYSKYVLYSKYIVIIVKYSIVKICSITNGLRRIGLSNIIFLLFFLSSKISSKNTIELVGQINTINSFSHYLIHVTTSLFSAPTQRQGLILPLRLSTFEKFIVSIKLNSRHPLSSSYLSGLYINMILVKEVVDADMTQKLCCHFWWVQTRNVSSQEDRFHFLLILDSFDR